MYYVYMIMNKQNKKIYIGLTKNVNNADDRFKQHIRYLKGNYHHNHKLQRDFNLHKCTDMYTHHLLCKCSSIKLAEKMEKFFIAYYNSKYCGFNLNDGGLSNKGYTQSDYAKKVASEVHSKLIGEKNPFFGRRHSEKTKMIISKKNKGRNKGIPKSDSHIKKMIENNARAKKVFVGGQIYSSCSQAQLHTGIDRKKISKLASDDSITNIYFIK
ncbi:GIY-YIG nuclease family protein [Bacillus subtilis]|nr:MULTISPECIES: GIY-YIG nuclease family protein [Bacillus]AMR46921.1 hypothetical protein KHRBS_10875 [Bacillus subtilis subsp. subtilis]MBE1868678.1 GIY-YIG nuclease family protein [Bacillus subtilis]MCT6513295.1 GIY-YIG nuclease family protein [Bacillus subtilis]MCX4076832.1 GIY-YIG nuclease family protein [Bacillus subtilis]MEC0434463.1 GIY-YIG nuclease family protein [Bacillus subtilis]